MTTRCGCGLTNNRLCANHIRLGWVDNSHNTPNEKSKITIKDRFMALVRSIGCRRYKSMK